jgi:primase-polymerase (primpol)-like protein
MYNIVDGSTDFHEEVGEKAARTKPIHLQVIHANIPENLKPLKLWVVWAYTWKDGRWCKLPFQPVMASQEYREKTGWALYAAKSNDRRTWSDYERVSAFHQQHPDLTDGIGIMLQEGLLGIDLDKCRDKRTGEVSAWGTDLVRRGDS